MACSLWPESLSLSLAPRKQIDRRRERREPRRGKRRGRQESRDEEEKEEEMRSNNSSRLCPSVCVGNSAERERGVCRDRDRGPKNHFTVVADNFGFEDSKSVEVYVLWPERDVRPSVSHV